MFVQTYHESLQLNIRKWHCTHTPGYILDWQKMCWNWAARSVMCRILTSLAKWWRLMKRCFMN